MVWYKEEKQEEDSPVVIPKNIQQQDYQPPIDFRPTQYPDETLQGQFNKISNIANNVSRKAIVDNLYNTIIDRLQNSGMYSKGDNYRFFRNLQTASPVISERSRFESDKQRNLIELSKLENDTILNNRKLNLEWFKENKPQFFSGSEYGTYMYSPQRGVLPVSNPAWQDPNFVALKLADKKQDKVEGIMTDKDWVNEYSKYELELTKLGIPSQSFESFKLERTPNIEKENKLHLDTKTGRLMRKFINKATGEVYYLPLTEKEEEYYKLQKEKNKK